MPEAAATCGVRILQALRGIHLATAPGHIIRGPATRGCRRIPGAGLHTTRVAGLTAPARVGDGCRAVRGAG